MKTLMKKSILVIVFVALISCERVDVPPSPERISHGMIELGEKLEDPYSVDNITKKGGDCSYGFVYAFPSSYGGGIPDAGIDC